MRACVRSHIFGGIRSNICENITMHVLHVFYVRTCVCTLCTHYARTCTARMCALTHYWTDSLQNWWRHTLGHRNVHLCCMCALACARSARGCTHMRAFVRSHIFGRISSNIGENIPLRGLYAFYMRTCVCTLYTHYARACTARIIYIYARSHILEQTLSKLLRVTESCMGYLIFTCALACARFAHACIHMRACVHSHIFRCYMETFLCIGYMICTWALAFAHYARTISMTVLHACARSHICGRIFSKLSGTFYGSQRYAWTTWFLYARLRVRTISICAFWDGFATNLMKTFIICTALNGHGIVALY
jgi:hypothetical protein